MFNNVDNVYINVSALDKTLEDLMKMFLNY